MEYSAQKIKEILALSNKKLSSSLGQNFLFDQQTLETITKEAVGEKCPNIVEIGAGVGLLTDILCKNAKKVVTIEIDDSLEEILRRTVPHKNFTLHLEDVLKADLREISNKYFNGERFVIVGNLPYYITTKIFDKLCENTHLFTKAVVMVQKEFADRLVTEAGQKLYRAVSLQAQTLFDIRRVCIVAPHLFVPPPHIESAVITLTPKAELPFGIDQISDYLRFTDKLFASRRKQLKSTAAAFGITSEQMVAALGTLGIAETVRGETLTPDTAAALFRIIQSK